MLYKLYFSRDKEHGFAEVYSTDIGEIDCPNKCGGIGNITIFGGSIWTGRIHLYSTPQGGLTFSFGSIVLVEARTDDSESDEYWVKVWEASDKFSYADYYQLAYLLKHDQSIIAPMCAFVNKSLEKK